MMSKSKGWDGSARFDNRRPSMVPGMKHGNDSGRLLQLTMSLLMGASLLAVAACSAPRYAGSVDRGALDDIQDSLRQSQDVAAASVARQGMPPEDVMRALVPGLSLSDQTFVPVEERFDFSVPRAIDIREFFSMLTAGTDYSIVVHPSITGTISSLDLKNVTLQEALDQISEIYGYGINRNGNIFQVMPGGLQTRIFRVDYLNVTRMGSSNMGITSTGIGAGLGGMGGMGGMGMGGLGMGMGGLGLGGMGFGGLGGLGMGGLGMGGLGMGGLGMGGLGMGGLGGLGMMGMGGMGGNAGGAMIMTMSQANFWNDLEDIIYSIISPARIQRSNDNVALAGLGNVAGAATSSRSNRDDERAVIVSPHTGMVVVKAYPSELDQVARYLEASQLTLQRQVVLEAKILEVELKEAFQSGIDLNAIARVNSGNTEIGFNQGFLGEQLSAIGTGSSLSVNSRDFDGVIRLLETQGNVQVISSPRISTLNNQKAVFKVGDEQYYLTNANTTSFGAGDQATTNQNTNLQPFFSGIALDVTPQISEGGDIILHIHPILSQVQEDIRIINGQEFPLANSTTRESDSIARARNGEVIVISGLMQTKARGQEAGLPGVRDVPVIGNAFEQRQRETVKTELVILLRAIVADDGVMKELIDEHVDGFERLRRQLDPYYR